jgi:hypothetical protein
VADGWCWFVVRGKYCWLVAGGWFVLREKYCWLVADKPSEQGAYWHHPVMIFVATLPADEDVDREWLKFQEFF